jgi:hypothetical protein
MVAVWQSIGKVMWKDLQAEIAEEFSELATDVGPSADGAVNVAYIQWLHAKRLQWWRERWARLRRDELRTRSVVTCPVCGSKFVPLQSRRRICSPECRRHSELARMREWYVRHRQERSDYHKVRTKKRRATDLAARPERACLGCGVHFVPLTASRTYCTEKCRCKCARVRQAAARKASACKEQTCM